MKKSPVFLLIILLTSLILSGCSSVSPSGSEGERNVKIGNTSTLPTNITPELNRSVVEEVEKPHIRVVDDFGFEVVINKTPERIVSLAPSNTEILFALGLGDRIVGVTDYDNYPPEAMKKPKIGGFSTVNIEKVLALNPDLVVAAYGNGAETVETLRGYGITVIALNPKNLTDVMRDIKLLGKVTGTEKNATKLVEMMEQKIREVEEMTANFSYKPKIAHIHSGTTRYG